MQTHELKRTVVGSDYLKHKADGKELPSVDCFLDFIIWLKKLKISGEYSPKWYDREIDAIKYILTVESQHMT